MIIKKIKKKWKSGDSFFYLWGISWCYKRYISWCYKGVEGGVELGY
tara:strand:+ start:272 stop:409 length:138 start_codon:yes stop_codon:yes gene_type:complete